MFFILSDVLGNTVYGLKWQACPLLSNSYIIKRIVITDKNNETFPELLVIMSFFKGTHVNYALIESRSLAEVVFVMIILNIRHLEMAKGLCVLKNMPFMRKWLREYQYLG